MLPKDGTAVTVVKKKKKGLVPSPDVGPSCLVILNGRNIGNRIPLEAKEAVLGRSEGVHIRIEDESISRKHAHLVQRPSGVWHIQDLGSTNGTFVNDRPISETELKDGDLIQVGQTILKYLSGAHVENKYYQEIFRLTHFDSLTQTYNKPFFLRTLEQELHRSRRYRHPLSLAMIDLDRFKTINDRFGHLAGDSVLRESAALFSARIRRTDFLGRYGGEEFGLILPETARMQAGRICRTLCGAMEAHRFSFQGHRIRLTVSIGIATVEKDFDDWTVEKIIALADDRLYEAKRKGRNQVIL